MGDVQVGVQPQLAQTAADSRHAGEDLLAHQMKRRLERRRLRPGRRESVPWGPSGDVRRLRPARGAILPLSLCHHRRQMASQLAGARARLPAHEGGGQAAQLLEARLLLGGVRGREQRAPAHAQTLDQASDEHVRLRRVEFGGGAAVQLGEPLDALACLRRHLGRLGGRGEARDQVQLAPARDLDHAREVDLAQLDRWTGECAYDRGGVLRIDEQAHPGEHVADLGPLEERTRGRLFTGAVAERRGRGPCGGHSLRIRASLRAGALGGPGSPPARSMRRATLSGWTRSIGAQPSGSESS